MSVEVIFNVSDVCQITLNLIPNSIINSLCPIQRIEKDSLYASIFLMNFYE